MGLIVDIEKKFKDFSLKVSFDNRSKSLGILGASGCGKSMTLKCIAGIEKPDQGIIMLNNRVLFDSEKKINIPPQERRVGYLFQNYALFPNMTVGQNIGVGIKHKKERKIKIMQMLQLLQIEELECRYPHQLSGGQQQRVALGRMLAYEPEFLLFDEPFSALDSYLKEQLKLELLEVVKIYSGDYLMVSHNRDELYQFCERMAVLNQGRIVAQGEIKNLFINPGSVEVAKLTGCKNISKAIKVSDHELFALDWNVKLITENTISEKISHVGIRAYDIREGTDLRQENTYPIEYVGCSEEPFQMNLLLKWKGDINMEQKIWWRITKSYWEHTLHRRLPESIHIPKEHIILMTSNT